MFTVCEKRFVAGVESFVVVEEFGCGGGEVHDEVGDDGRQGDACRFLGDGGDGFGAGGAFGCYCCAFAAEGGCEDVVGCFVDEEAAVFVEGADELVDLDFVSARISSRIGSGALTLFF